MFVEPVIPPPGAEGLPGPVYLCRECSSSLDVARELGPDRLPEWGSVLALCQSRGRGQLGRGWVSPPGNLYAALRLPLLPPFDGHAAAPAMGALLAAALEGLGFRVLMKWPNDILLAEGPATAWRKVGGVLLEERGGRLFAGCGLNLVSAPPDSALRAERAHPAGVLPEAVWSRAGDVVGVWLALVRVVAALGQGLIAEGGQGWLPLAEARLACLGREVCLRDGPDDADVYSGRLLGLDAAGGLRLDVNGRRMSFHSGSLSLAAREWSA